VKKTTIYLSDELKQRLQQTARANGTSEAEVIRTAIERFTRDDSHPRPRWPLFDSERGGVAERVDEILADGFGKD
jgi:hypothetical protein